MDFDLNITGDLNLPFDKEAALDLSPSLLGLNPTKDTALPSLAAPLSIKPEVTKLDYTDYPTFRQKLMDDTREAVKTAFPISNARYTLGLSDVDYEKKRKYSIKEQKKAILEGRSLTNKLIGRYEITDNETGQVVSRSGRKTLMNVPYMTNRGTFIRNGSEVTVAKQFRLVPGVYTRKTDDGKFESQFNVKKRTGQQFRVFMDPATSVFYMRVKNRKLPLLPVMKAMGHDEEDFRRRWGDEIFKRNKKHENSPHAISFIRSYQNSAMEKKASEIPKATIIKGNREYTADNPKADSFYDELKAILTEKGYDVSFDEGAAYTTPSKTDSLWVGHSKGADRLRFAPKGLQTLALGAPEYKGSINNPADKSKVGKTPGNEHYELTEDMKNALLSRLSKTASVQDIDVSQYDETARQNLNDYFNKMELDEDSTESTLGVRYKNISTDTIADSTSRILGIARGETDIDNRDSLEFQTVHDVADFLRDKVKNDQNGVARQMLWKVTNKNGDLSKIHPGLLDAHVKHLFNNSGMAQNLEEINPMDMLDQSQRVVRLGEGAMTTVDVVPKEARNVQPSYFNFVDPVRAPESLKIGVDMKFARGTRKGSDGLLYTKFQDARTGEDAWVNQKVAARSNLATREDMAKKGKFVVALKQGKGMEHVRRETVDYVVPNGDDLFSIGANLVPLKAGVKGMRLLMGSKFAPQALPLTAREAPLVQTTSFDGKNSTEHNIGTHMGALRAKQSGRVTAVRKDRIEVEYEDGSKENIEMYDNFPFSRKTFIRNMPKVKAGDLFEEGGLLATSNFTDDKGVAALGSNMRIAYMNYDGKVFEDAIVISESAAKKKLTSEHMYHDQLDVDKETIIGKDKYRHLYPGKFDKRQFETLDEDGLAKPGTTVNYGDPLVIAYKQSDPDKSTMGRSIRKDASIVWKHHYPGVVTDAAKGKKGHKIYVRANAPMNVGDKLANRFGGKGVISHIVKDENMPRDAKGKPYEVILSPLGVVSRTNSAQMIEVALGKVAEKTGKAYTLPGFMDESMIDFALNELKKHNLKDRDEVYDPRTKKNIPGIFAGTSYFYKLQHTSEGKGKARSVASYTADEQPSKGGKTGAKHIGDMEIQAILSHGAGAVLKDLKIVKGQKNDDFWRALKLGQTPTMPGTPFVYGKFKDLIKAAGVDLREGKHGDQIFAMSNAKAQELTGTREIKTSDTYSANNMKPIPGGLFDPDATGSKGNGDRWSYIKLPEPSPNPIMIEPMRSLLGLKQKEFDELMSEGGQAVIDRLHKIDLPSERRRAIDLIKTGAKSKRDAAVKRLGYIEAFERQGADPTDFMMTRVPVLPPRYRPITQAGGLTTVADPNYLYKSLLESIEDFKDTKELSPAIQKEARMQIFNDYKALVGLTDPTQEKLQQKNVGGLLQQIFGKGSPKTGFVQRRVIGTNIDMSGLGVITPNPALKLNEVGMPETQAWNLYEPFIIRKLVRAGTPATVAAKAVADHTPQAYSALQEVVKERPVLINRAPTLHKYNIMAFYPVLTKGNTLQVPPPIVGPFAADFDGDTMAYTVPVSDDAVREAKELMMPDKNLLSAKDDSPNYGLSNEYLQGLWAASKAPEEGKPIVFATKHDAMVAYKKGLIRLDTNIEIQGQ